MVVMCGKDSMRVYAKLGPRISGGGSQLFDREYAKPRWARPRTAGGDCTCIYLRILSALVVVVPRNISILGCRGIVFWRDSISCLANVVQHCTNFHNTTDIEASLNCPAPLSTMLQVILSVLKCRLAFYNAAVGLRMMHGR